MLVVERHILVAARGAAGHRHVVLLGELRAPHVVAELVVVVVAAPPGQCLVHLSIAQHTVVLVAVQLVQGLVVAGGREVVLLTTGLGHGRLVHLRLEVYHVARLGIMHALEVGLGADIPVGIHIHAHAVVLALLGGDDYHAVGSQGTVDAAGGSVFQHGHRLHVVGVDLVERHARGDVVDDDQRLRAHIVREGAHTTQDGCALACVGVDVEPQAGHLALQRAQQVFVHLLGELLAVDESERASGIGALDGLVTRHHHVVERRLVVLHHKVHHTAQFGLCLLGPLADEGQRQPVACSTAGQREASVFVGDGILLIGQIAHHDAAHGHIILVAHASAHNILRVLLLSRRTSMR